MSRCDFERRTLLFGMTAAATWPATARAAHAPVKDLFVPARTSPLPSGDGLLGRRMVVNTRERLGKIALDDILAPYVHRPGAQEWAGEHVGKFLHAGVLAVRHRPDTHLRKRLDRAALTLIRAQLGDGYLGTYERKDRWTSWDVWSHKYNLLGLLAYHDLTGSASALSACKRIGDLLCRIFGDGAGQLDIVAEQHSTHMGMASTSVLEPMALLHRRTGISRYLDFCHHLLTAWERPHGPQLLSSLGNHGNVFKTANGKAYEMLSNIVGLAELHRTTGAPRLLEACTNAWQDIVDNRHYLIGTTSWAEHFQDDGVLNPGGRYFETKFVAAGEGCVTVTWQQLNWQLLRLTGEVRYADLLERIAYNALIGAQAPDNGQISYFSPLIGRKRYGEVNHGITPDVCCCASSQPRGIAMLTEMMAGTIDGAPTVVFYEPARHAVTATTSAGPQAVQLSVESNYPVEGAARVTVYPARNAAFSLRLRVPAWADRFTARVAGASYEGQPGSWLSIQRTWNAGDVVEIELPLDFRVSDAGAANPGKVFVERGPQVLATDENVNATRRIPGGWHGHQLYRLSDAGGAPLLLVPFSDAGQSRAEYSVPVARQSALRPEGDEKGVGRTAPRTSG